MSIEAESAPAQVFSLAEILADEMDARGWTSRDVAMRMSDRTEFGIRCLAFELLLCCPTEINVTIPDEDFAELARVFGASEQYFRNVHDGWLKWPDRRASFECPDHLLTGSDR